MLFTNICLPWYLGELRLEVPKARPSASHEMRQIPEMGKPDQIWGILCLTVLAFFLPLDLHSLFQCEYDDVVNGN